jgi:hypothetical protein
VCSLTSLDLACNRVMVAGVQVLCNTTAAPNLHIKWEPRSFFEVSRKRTTGTIRTSQRITTRTFDQKAPRHLAG